MEYEMKSQPIVNAPSLAKQFVSKYYEILIALVLGALLTFWNFESWFSSGLIQNDITKMVIAYLALSIACIYIGHAIAKYRPDKFGGEDQRTIALAHITFVGITSYLSLLGFKALAFEYSQEVFVPYICAALLFILTHKFSERLWLKQSVFKRLINIVILTVCIFVSTISNSIALFPYIGYANVVDKQADSAVNYYRENFNKVNTSINLMIEQLQQLSSYSLAQAQEEKANGQTCEVGILGSPEGGPRYNLRKRDKDVLGKYAEDGLVIKSALDELIKLLNDTLKIRDVADKQLKLNAVNQSLNDVLERSRQLGKPIKHYLVNRIRKGRDGWSFKDKYQNDRVAYCRDTRFDMDAESTVSYINNVNGIANVAAVQLLDLGEEHTIVAISHLIKEVSSGEFKSNFEYYKVTFVIGIGLDLLILLIFICLKSKHARNGLVCAEELVSSFDPVSKCIVISTQSQKELFLKLMLLCEHYPIKYKGVDKQSGKALFKLSNVTDLALFRK
ncbi:hypothetical protein H5154_22375 [Pseudoalteromonas sp. SR44-5]|uniref:hypothetical protein n=1 Tax=Pseudoalteromonas sp. SR44-5 TaxID=2760934 RepID=UPI001603F7E1|nr:hypothetical protein [Pseudoalteromonas sp. SR44-5]MBB1369082.1 hypothetical protein [Pseudoalteromonas sp. SR44-5]